MEATQKERLLLHLKSTGRIDPLMSWRALGIYRLAPRIHELRRDGHHITSKRVKFKNRFGEEVCVSEYVLEGQA